MLPEAGETLRGPGLSTVDDSVLLLLKMVKKGKKGRSSVWKNSSLTWDAGDAEHVGVADEEALQDVPGLVGVDDHGFGGGLGAGADPDQRGQLVLVPQLLLLLLQTQREEGSDSGAAGVLISGNLEGTGKTSTLSSWSSWSRLLWDPAVLLGLSGPGTSL